MDQPTQDKTYKSPTRKLIRFFEKSRDQWKLKHQQAQARGKRLSHRVRFLEKSKERWKSQVQELEQEVIRLKVRERVLEQELKRLEKKEQTNRQGGLLPRIGSSTPIGMGIRSGASPCLSPL